VSHCLDGYATKRNRSPKHTSALSPYLHFGHLGIHELAERVLLSGAPTEDVDSFLEEAIIRRELSFNLCFFRKDHDSLSALPDWAKNTLDKHRGDRRKPSYTVAQLEAAESTDDVWNLAQRQLLDQGTMHGYLRMLWGKKVLEWMDTPEEAHAFLIEQHAKYALDGRDPNTHAGVLWCFGKHDRPWAPERPIFGMIRYMSSASTAKKVRLKEL
jgi:deoxyribodipyrimidine photo-lyase